MAGTEAARPPDHPKVGPRDNAGPDV